jgi:viroplasmin and RNaseH domain-containing protein
MFLLFAGHRYYPLGGSQDFKGIFETIEDAKQWFRDNKESISESYIDLWADVLNAKTMESVAYGLIDESPSRDEAKEKWYSNVTEYLEDW